MMRNPVCCLACVSLLSMLVAGCVTPPACFTSITPVSRITFTAVDIETTGLDAKTARIIEIGAIRFRNGVTQQRRAWLINPGIPVPASAVRVHGISSEMLGGSPPFADVMPEVEKFIDGTVLLAHNARFDNGFFRAEFARSGTRAPANTVLDTLPLCRKWFPDALRHSLQYMSDYCDIASDQPHRALDDAATLRSLFNRGMRTEAPQMSLGDLVKKAGGEYRLGEGTPVAAEGGGSD